MTKTVLVLIDIQREYTTPDRPFYLNGIEESLSHCRSVLEAARASSSEIIHIQHLRPGSAIFSPDSGYADLEAGFQPQAGELHIRKSLYSCYSSPEFRELMEEHQDDSIYVIGYNTIMCCLSTLIEAYHRGHRLTLVGDASYAKSTSLYSEADMHSHAISIIREARYAELVNTEALLAQMSGVRASRSLQPHVLT